MTEKALDTDLLSIQEARDLAVAARAAQREFHFADQDVVDRICAAMAQDLPSNLQDLTAEYFDTSRRRVLELLPELHPRARRAAEAVAHTNPIDRWPNFDSAARELLVSPDCPRLEALARRWSTSGG